MIEEIKALEGVKVNDYSEKARLVIGDTYHLYVNNKEEVFLSLICPNEWNQKYVGSFKLDSSEKWIKVS